MSEYIHLIGAEDVKSGGFAVERGAQEMKLAVSNLEYVLQQHRSQQESFMNDWLYRFQAIVEKGIEMQLYDRPWGRNPL